MRFSPGSASLSPSLFSRLLSLFMLIWLVACGQGTPGVQQRANANLLDMQVMEGKGSWYFDYELSRDRSDYRLMVDSSQDQLVLVVKPEDIDAMVEINGQDNMAGRAFAIALEFGQNTPIEIVVTAADGSTQRVYTVTVLRPNNRSAQLQSLRVEAAASLPLAPNFSPDVLNYKLTVPYGQSSVSVVFTAHPQAAVLVDNQPVESGKISPAKMLQVGSNYIQILVRAQDGISTQSYNIEIIREGSNAHKQNDRLQSLQVDGFGLDKPFQPALSSYRVNVGNSVSSITVQPVPQNELATVTVDGRAVDGGAASVPLQLGTQNVIVKVVSEDGKFEREYILTVTRQLRIEARLQSLSLTAANKLLDFGFSSEISSYDLSVPNSATSIMLHPKAVDADALIEIDGKVVVNDTNANVALPNVGVQQVLVTVSAQDRSVRRSYVLNVNRVPLTNVKLRSLELPADLQFSFSPAVTEYAVTVPFERDNLALTAMLDDASSSLKINGAALPSGQSTDYLSLVVGSNRIELLVTDKYGFDHNSYVLNVVREGSGRAELTSLNLDLTNAGLQFDPAVLDYTLAVPNTRTELWVNAVAAENAVIEVALAGTVIDKSAQGWKVPLQVGQNKLSLSVTSQNSANQRTYNLVLTRSGSSNANLATLTPSFGAITPAFAPATSSYSANVANSVASFNVQATTEFPRAKVELQVDGHAQALGSAIDLPSGVAKTVQLVVTAEDGSTKKTYDLNVTRQRSSNAALAGLSVGGSVYTPAFASDVLAYALNVSNADGSMQITATTESPGAKLYVNNVLTASGKPSAAVPLIVGENVITLRVDSEDGQNTRAYKLTVNRALSANAELTALASPQGALTFVGAGVYKIDVSYETSSLWLQPTLADSSASMLLDFKRVQSGNQSSVFPLQVGENNVHFEVEAQDGTRKSYTARITRAKSNNAQLAGLILSSGSLSPVFAPATLNYTTTVAYGVADLTVTPQTADVGASYLLWLNGQPLTGNVASLPVGTSQLMVKVIAADSQTTQSYELSVTRLPSANNVLRDLQLSDNVVLSNFDPNVSNYTVNVANTLSSIRLIPFMDHVAATATVAGVSVASGQPSNPQSLQVGNNLLSVTVTAQNGAVRTYQITVVRAQSSDARLLDLALSAGSLSPTFHPDVLSYTSTVGNLVPTVKLTPSAAHAKASITVNGQAVSSGFASQEIALNVGSNLLTVVVKAEAGNLQTYSIDLTRLQSSNANLVSLISPEGTLTQVGTAFSMNVVNTTDTIRLTPTMEHQNAALYVNGERLTSGQTSLPLTVSVGNNMFYVTGEAQDGTRKTYTVAVNRALSSNANLLSLIPSHGTLSPAFSPSQLSYTVSVSYAVDQVTLTPQVAQNSAWVAVDNVAVPRNQASQVLGLSVGNNPFAVVVTAEDGSSKTYTVNFARQPSDNANLSAIGLSRGSLDSAFSPSKLSYAVNLPNDASSLTISPVLAQADASVKINGVASNSRLVTLPVGSTNVSIAVTAQNGTTSKTYSLTVNRAASSNAKLQSLNVSSGGLSPLFDANTNSYNVIVGNAVDSISVTAAPQDSTATMVVNGSVLTPGVASTPIALYVGSVQPVVVEVSAQDGTARQYTVNVTRQQSAVANLSALVPSVGSLSPVFNQTTTDYRLDVVNSVSSVKLTPTTQDSTASVQVNGVTVASGTASPSIAVAVGDTNFITVRVTAQNGSTAMEYRVNVVRAGSSNADLSGLTVSSGTLSPAFAANTTSYTLQVGNNIDTLTLTPQVADSNAKLKINGVAAAAGVGYGQALVVGANNIAIEVQAQNGNLKTYQLSVTRVASNNANLSALTLSSGSLMPVFGSFTNSYSVSLVNSVTSISLTPTVADSASTLKVNGVSAVSGAPTTPVALVVGNTLFSIVVTAQDGTQKTYSVSVNRAASSNANLADLKVLGAVVSPTFTANTVHYSGVVANDVGSVQLLASPADATATLALSGTALTPGQYSAPQPLTVGQNDLQVTVTAQDGTVKNYTVSITRQQSDVANLAALQPSTGSLSPVFSATTASYTVNVANAVASIKLTPTLQDLTASVRVNGVAVVSGQASQAVGLNVGSNYISVTVTAQNGSTTMTYVVNVQREGSSNADLSGLTLSSGVLSPAFSAGVTSYSVSLANSVSSLSITPQLADSTASVSINSTQVSAGGSLSLGLQVGNNIIDVVVTAQNGAQKTYRVTATRAMSSNADLSALSVSSGILAPSFTAGVTSYSVNVGNDVTGMTLRPTVADGSATVKVNTQPVVSGQLSSVFALAVGANNFTVQVTAQDGTQKNYIVTVNRAKSSNATLASVTLSAGTLNFAPSTTVYNVSVDNAVSSLSLTAVVADSKASLKVNNTATTSGQSVNLPLVVGINSVALLVTAEDGSTLTYQLNITRLVNSNADLVSLGVSSGSLSPAFSRDQAFYTVNVANGVSSMRLTPQAADAANAKIEVEGVVVTSGSASADLPLQVGHNYLDVWVTAADGVTQRQYQVDVVRAGNNNANLSNLTLSAGNLVFNGSLSYNVTVPYAASSVTVKPTLADSNAIAVINGQTLMSNQVSNPISLLVGANDGIQVWVTAEDGTTQKTYTINVTREAASNNANLIDLRSSLGALDQPFSASGLNYTQTVVNSYNSMYINATAADSSASISINGISVFSGMDFSVSLAPGANVFNIVVTAADGTKKTYVLTVTRQLSSNTQLTWLAVGTAGQTMTPAFSSGTRDYNLLLPNSVVAVDVTASWSESGMKVMYAGVQRSSGFSLSQAVAVGDTTLTLDVTAADGVATGKYRVFVHRISSDAALSALTLSTGGLSPVFSAGTLTYTAQVANSVTTVGVTATTRSNAYSSLKINNLAVTSGQLSNFALSVGDNLISVVATAEDGVTQMSYSIIVNRAAPANTVDATVCASGCNYSSIQSAINGVASGAVIEVQAGTYSGALSFGTKAVTLRSASGSAVTTLTANTGGPVVSFSGTVGAVLDGFTIDNTYGGASGSRGVMVADNSQVMIANSVITGNSIVGFDGTAIGAGILFRNNTATSEMHNVSISGNGAKYGGGGLGLDNASVRLTGKINIDNNNVSQGGGGGIAAINGSRLEIDASGVGDSSINANYSRSGGAGISFDGSVGGVSSGSFSLQNIGVDSNSTASMAYGGGVNLRNVAGTSMLVNCSISNNNEKSGGGGLYATAAMIDMQYCTVSGNRLSQGSGGGIWLDTAGSRISNSTITGNVVSTESGSGGGLALLGAAQLDQLVISGNTAYNDGGGLVSNSDLVLTNSLISGNVTTFGGCCGRDGGGIALFGAVTRQLSHVTVVGNRSYDYGGIYVEQGTTSIDNSILWGNTAHQGTGDLVDNQLNNVAGVTLSNSVIDGGWNGGGSYNVSTIPAFADWQAASGTTATSAGDFRLCVNASTPVASCASSAGGFPSVGIDMAPAGSTPQNHDLLGSSRPLDIQGVGNSGSYSYDAGAYEAATNNGNYTVFQSLSASKSSATSILVSVSWLGDANYNNTIRVEYKLSSATQWTTWMNATGLVTSPASTTITGLQAGQVYEVRATFTDPDGTSSTNPQQTSVSL